VIRATAAAFGVVFGFALSWTGLADPSFIHKMLSPQTAYPYLLMATSVALTSRRPGCSRGATPAHS